MLLEVLSYLAAGFILIYSIQFFSYGSALASASIETILSKKDPGGKVSLIIPVRDEVNNLEFLISDLTLQSYPKHLFEVIFVDDHSTDGSRELLGARCSEISNFSLVILEDRYAGKKIAIDTAIQQALGEWIIQTDADCRLPVNFIANHASMLAGNVFTLVAGPVRINSSKGLWNKLESLEFLSISSVGIASFLRGRPTMCNGANLSFSKKFYQEVREDLLKIPSASGDDIFLLTKAKEKKKHIGFLYSREAVVTTLPAGSFQAFLKQRIRWGSKAKQYRDRDLSFLSIVVWLANASLVFLLIGGIFKFSLLLFFLALFGIKSIIDIRILITASSFYQQSHLLWHFPLTAIFYYFYITFAGVISMVGKFSWKGRYYS